MPLAPEPTPTVLKLWRGRQALRIAAVEADGQLIYVGFKDQEPLVVSASAGDSLRELLRTVGLPPSFSSMGPR